MKTWIIAATGAALLAGGVAIAQPAPPPPGGPAGPPGMEEHHGGRGHRSMGGWMRHGGPPMKAAVFSFHKGDGSVTIKCAADEPMKACIEAGAMFIDKLGTLSK